jgi:hypothetical protein
MTLAIKVGVAEGMIAMLTSKAPPAWLVHASHHQFANGRMAARWAAIPLEVARMKVSKNPKRV